MKLSVICPIYNEQKYIANCINSILKQDFPKEDMEVLFVDGMSKDKTREIVSEYSHKYPFIKLLDNPHKIVPFAMNIGIEAAKGDVIMRLDAHAAYQTNYFSALYKALFDLGSDNVGAACRTDVLNKTPKTLAIKEVLQNKFGVGNSTFRLGVDKVQEVDTVPFGCWKRDVFEKCGKYDVRLVRNQDIELNKRILRGGGKIFIIPETYSTYYARETYKALAKNNYGNGKWNILTVYYTGELRSLSVRHFVPLAFVLAVLLPLICAIFWWPAIFVSAAALLAYIGLYSLISAKEARAKGLNFFRLLQSFFIVHVSYGWGSLMGILQLPFIKRKPM